MGNKLFKKEQKEEKYLMFGLTNSGKTTTLYKLFYGEIVTTINTMGFNQENIIYQKVNHHIYDISWIFHRYDLYHPNNLNKVMYESIVKYDSVSSLSDFHLQIKKLYDTYDTQNLFQNVTGIIFVIDCNDRDRWTDKSLKKSKFNCDNNNVSLPHIRKLNEAMVVHGYCRNNAGLYELIIPNGIVNMCYRYYAVGHALNTVKGFLEQLIEIKEFEKVPFLLWGNKMDLPNAMYKSSGIIDALDLKTLMKGREWCLQLSCSVTGDGLYEGLDWFADLRNRKN
eukprot:51910_1